MIIGTVPSMAARPWLPQDTSIEGLKVAQTKAHQWSSNRETTGQPYQCEGPKCDPGPNLDREVAGKTVPKSTGDPRPEASRWTRSKKE